MYILYSALSLGLILGCYMLFIEPRRLKQRHYLIQKQKQKIWDISNAYDLYQEQTNITIAHISDTHFSRSFHPRRLNKVIRSILQTSPDIVVFTGDLIDNYQHWPHRHTKRLVEKLKRISAPMGKIAILGNHDYEAEGEYFVEEVLKSAGFTFLKNEQIFGANEKISITIVGVDDTIKGQPEFAYEPTLAEWHILLMHEPDGSLSVEHLDSYDLVLSGHSHGGQVNLPFIHYSHVGANKYRRGLYLLSERTLLSVSNGIGTTILPIRLGATPEIIYYHLANKEEKEKKQQ